MLGLMLRLMLGLRLGAIDILFYFRPNFTWSRLLGSCTRLERLLTLFTVPWLLPSSHGGQQLDMVLWSALLTVICSGLPFIALLETQALDVLPCLTDVAGDHLSPFDIPLHAADATDNSVILSFVLGLCRLGAGRLDRLCLCTSFAFGRSLWRRFLKRILILGMMTLVGAARSSWFVSHDGRHVNWVSTGVAKSL